MSAHGGGKEGGHTQSWNPIVGISLEAHGLKMQAVQQSIGIINRIGP